MDLEVLLSIMHCNNLDFLSGINLESDCIIVNQLGLLPAGQYIYKNNKINILTFQEKGIGLSRNSALMRAASDVVLFADHDMVFKPGYKDIILNNFEKNPLADVILFNVPSLNPKRPTAAITKSTRLNKFNCLKYGAVNIAVRTQQIKKKNIYFSLMFGGGAAYSSGEDSLFLLSCLEKKLKIFSSPEVIGFVKQEESTWFDGYNKKYLFDKGAFWSAAMGKLGFLYCVQDALRHKKAWNTSLSFREVLLIMLHGWKSY